MRLIYEFFIACAIWNGSAADGLGIEPSLLGFVFIFVFCFFPVGWISMEFTDTVFGFGAWVIWSWVRSFVIFGCLLFIWWPVDSGCDWLGNEANGVAFGRHLSLVAMGIAEWLCLPLMDGWLWLPLSCGWLLMPSRRATDAIDSGGPTAGEGYNVVMLTMGLVAFALWWRAWTGYVLNDCLSRLLLSTSLSCSDRQGFSANFFFKSLTHSP